MAWCLLEPLSLSSLLFCYKNAPLVSCEALQVIFATAQVDHSLKWHGVCLTRCKIVAVAELMPMHLGFEAAHLAADSSLPCSFMNYKALRMHSRLVDDSDETSLLQRTTSAIACAIAQQWVPIVLPSCLQVLASGAVLVDLPGTQDSNVARGSVAENYLKHCNAIWIVSPIIRAVNDRAAKVHFPW